MKQFSRTNNIKKNFSKATFVRLYITSAFVGFMLRVCNVKEFRQVLAT